MRGSLAASAVRNIRRPRPWMKVVPQAVVWAVQVAKIDSLLFAAAQAAIASALSSSCEALSPCTRSEFASIENPSVVGSLNTVPTGAAPVGSLKMLWMLAANSGPLSRHSLRGPGALLVQGSGGLSTLGCCLTIGPASGLALVPPAPPLPVPPSPLPRPAQPEATNTAKPAERTPAAESKPTAEKAPAARSEGRCIRSPEKPADIRRRRPPILAQRTRRSIAPGGAD